MYITYIRSYAKELNSHMYVHTWLTLVLMKLFLFFLYVDSKLLHSNTFSLVSKAALL